MTVRLDREAHKQRHTVERGINQLKRNRAAATRHDKHAVRYQATLHIAAAHHISVRAPAQAV